MKKTDNYSLPQWEKQDFIKMEDFNDAFGKTDAALKANADAVGALEVGKADAAALSALQTALGSGGKNCRIATCSYVGTGTYGAGNPTSLHFDFKPLLVILSAYSTQFLAGHVGILQNPSTLGYDVWRSKSATLTWSENGVQWYAADAQEQWNINNCTYFCIALGCSE